MTSRVEIRWALMFPGDVSSDDDTYVERWTIGKAPVYCEDIEDALTFDTHVQAMRFLLESTRMGKRWNVALIPVPISPKGD